MLLKIKTHIDNKQMAARARLRRGQDVDGHRRRHHQGHSVRTRRAQAQLSHVLRQPLQGQRLLRDTRLRHTHRQEAQALRARGQPFAELHHRLQARQRDQGRAHLRHHHAHEHRRTRQEEVRGRGAQEGARAPLPQARQERDQVSALSIVICM